jgi:two-component system LytT family sensor kinase
VGVRVCVAINCLVFTQRGTSVHDLIYPPQQIILGSGREISKATLFRALHFGGWLAEGVVVFAWGMSIRGPLIAGVDELIWIISGIGLTSGFRIICRRARAAAVSYQSLGMLILLFGVAGAVVWYVIYLTLLRAFVAGWGIWFGSDAGIVLGLSPLATQPWIIPIRTWIICGCLLLTWSSLYFGINAIIDLEVERERAARAVKLADRARLSALQTQLNPHFLFNALNGIAALIRANDRATAVAMVDDFGAFLRAILQKLDSPEISVAEEIALVTQYLQIQRRRFGNRLRTTIQIEPETMGACLPTLILQPLVENALQHGILVLEGGGSIQVAIRRRDDKLVVSVSDDGAGTESGGHATGLGLRNCADRLSALYGKDAHLSAGAGRDGKGFAVEIELPFRQERPATLVTDGLEALA